MNQRIEQLTRNYLNSLSLPYSLNNGKKQKVIEINSQTEWIIFNASSLQSIRIEAANYEAASYITIDRLNRTYSREEENFVDIDYYLRRYLNLVGGYTIEIEEENVLDSGGNLVYNVDGTPQKRPSGRRFVCGRLRNPDGSITSEHRLNYPGQEREYSFSPERYKIISPALQSIIEEAVKIYEPESIGNTDKIENLVFTGGKGLSDRGFKISAITTSYYNGKGEAEYWVAINKKELAEQYANLCIASLNNDCRQWQEYYGLSTLLNDQNIANSRERERERENRNPTTKQQLINRRQLLQ